MPLLSRLFKGDERLEACLVKDSAHLTPGTTGDFVGKVQAALEHIEKVRIAEAELAGVTYGTSTAAAVLAYKTKRKIINQSYQRTADDIVGKMTIQRLDEDMVALEAAPKVVAFDPICRRPDFGLKSG
jgi:hypothetical protein